MNFILFTNILEMHFLDQIVSMYLGSKTSILILFPISCQPYVVFIPPFTDCSIYVVGLGRINLRLGSLTGKTPDQQLGGFKLIQDCVRMSPPPI